MRTIFSKNFAPVLSLVFMLNGCSMAFQPPIAAPPQLAEHTMSGDLLASLPPAKRKPVVSVYEFQDQTGQMKQDDTFAEYSHAVTQGGLSILNKALLDAGHKGWFTVIERGGLKNLVQERQIIKVTRNEYKAPGQPVMDVKPMLFAGIILEGGIVAYESNITTGGLGAKYLGVGGDVQYRRDIVTVYLRAVSTQTGEILTSVNTSKTIYSTAVDASIYRFVSFDKLLELETGFTANEPPQFAVRQAIEMAVYALIMEGSIDGLWDFQDPQAGKAAVAEYLERKGETPRAAPSKPEPVTYRTVTPAPVPVPAPAPMPAPAPYVAPAQPQSQVVPVPPHAQQQTITLTPPTSEPAASANIMPNTNYHTTPLPPAPAPSAAIIEQSSQAYVSPPQSSARPRLLQDNAYSGMRATTRRCNDMDSDDCGM